MIRNHAFSQIRISQIAESYTFTCAIWSMFLFLFSWLLRYCNWNPSTYKCDWLLVPNFNLFDYLPFIFIQFSSNTRCSPKIINKRIKLSVLCIKLLTNITFMGKIFTLITILINIFIQKINFIDKWTKG